MRGPTLGLGLLLIAAGLAGFFRAGSTKSLWFGVSGGVALLYSWTLMVDPALRLAPALALAVVGGLGAKMAARYRQTGKVVPAGALAGVCGVASLGYVKALM